MVTNPLGHTTTAVYNAANQLDTTTDPTGATTQNFYTPNTGWLSSTVVAGARRTEFVYDDYGRVSFERRTTPTGPTVIAETGFGYDPAGNRTSIKRPNGVTDTFTYDQLSRLTTSNIDVGVGGTPTLAVSEAGYDIAGNLVRVKDARNNITTMTYNNWGLASSVTEPSTTAHPTVANRKWTVTYNAAGFPTTEVRPGAVTVIKSYDNLNRLTGESGTGTGVVSATRSFQYDLGGRLTVVGGQTLGYDSRNNLRTATGTMGSSTYTYDLVNRMTGRTDAAGTSTFDWTARSQLLSIVTNSTTTGYTWYPSGELDTVTYPGSTSRKYMYDDLGRPVSDVVKNSSAVTISSRLYEYNEDSTVKKTTITQPGNTAAGVYLYGYDRGARLTSMTSPSNVVTNYGYDLAGNRTTAGSATFVYDARNRLMSGGGTTYNWTPRGTLSSTTGTGAATYVHDGLDRLTQAGTVTYAYDSLDRVATRTVGGVATAFSYAGVEMDPVAEGTVTKYLRGPSGQSVHGIVRNGTMTIAGMDRHGDVSFTLSTAGAITDTKVSDPFGKTLAATGTVPNVGFQSDYTDPTSGLVWMGARWYNPNTGTFTARDTVPGSVGAYATMNRYTYGLNNPVTFNDPTGRVAAPAGCDNACQVEYTQQTGDVYEDRTYYENEDGSFNAGVYVTVDGDTISVVSPSGVTISDSSTTSRSTELGWTPTEDTGFAVRIATSAGTGDARQVHRAIDDSGARAGALSILQNLVNQNPISRGGGVQAFGNGGRQGPVDPNNPDTNPLLLVDDCERLDAWEGGFYSDPVRASRENNQKTVSNQAVILQCLDGRRTDSKSAVRHTVDWYKSHFGVEPDDAYSNGGGNNPYKKYGRNPDLVAVFESGHTQVIEVKSGKAAKISSRILSEVNKDDQIQAYENSTSVAWHLWTNNQGEAFTSVAIAVQLQLAGISIVVHVNPANQQQRSDANQPVGPQPPGVVRPGNPPIKVPDIVPPQWVPIRPVPVPVP